MALEPHAPRSLVSCLNDPEELSLFEHYMSLESNKLPSSSSKTKDIYDSQRSVFISSHSEMALKNAVGSYLSKFPLHLNPNSCTWTEVVDELERSEAEYNKKGALRLRPGPGIRRNLVQALDLIEAIPTEYGLGTLKTGLAIIFKAVRRRCEAREKILDCFSSVPEWLLKAHDLQKLYKRSEKLTKKVRDFYHALFECLTTLISMLLRQENTRVNSSSAAEPLSIWSRGKAKVGRATNDLFGDQVNEVEGHLVPVHSALRALKDCAKYLDSEGIQTTNRKMSELGAGGQQTRLAVVSLSGKLDSKIDQLREDMERRSRETEGFLREFLGYTEESLMLAMKNNIHFMLAESQRCQILRESWSPGSRHAWRMRYPAARPTRHWNLNLDKLLEAVASDKGHMAAAVDREEIVRMQHQFKPKALSHAYQLFESGEFRDWISSSESEVLAVEGHCIPHSRGAVSPMSIFCASLAHVLSFEPGDGDESLGRASLTDSILFFACGQHSLAKDELAGPRGIMRSMISQLLISRMRWNERAGHSSTTPDLSFLEESESLWPQICVQSSGRVNVHSNISDDLDNRDELEYSPGQRHLQALLNVFRELLLQVPRHSTVYCIMDGISYYEGPWRTELLLLVRSLMDICYDQQFGNGGPQIKILMTSPGRFYWLDQVVKQEEDIRPVLMRMTPGTRAAVASSGADMIRRMGQLWGARPRELSRFESDDFQARGMGQRKEQEEWLGDGGWDEHREVDSRRRARSQERGGWRIRRRDSSL